MSPLPRFVVLKSVNNGKYLSKISNEESTKKGLQATFLKFHGEEIASPFAKFEVETAKKNPEFVHIRCCHNNKYLVRLLGEGSSSRSLWIVAAANKSQEDVDVLSCTMFKPVQSDENHFRFLHVESGRYARLSKEKEPYTDGLLAGSSSIDTDLQDVYKVFDWESLVVFPKIVAFKLGDKYLSHRWIEGYPYLQFVSTDSGDQTIANEISTFGDGFVRIRSLSTGNFWRRSPNWIWADSTDSTGSDSNTLFLPIKLADNVVALRNLGNNCICKSLTTEGKTDCLNAAVHNIINDAKLEVEESVLSRSIYNINFRRDEGRVYNLKVIEKGHSEADNYTNVENTVSLKFSYKKTSASTIGGSVSLKLGVKTPLQIAAIPLIVEGKVEISGEVTTAVQWGKTEAVETVTETTYSAKVPPMTKTIVTLTGTEGMCDVPFSYTQRDILHNGDPRIQNMDDGIYTGINMFGFKFDSHQQKLPADYYK
ncbi:hypothetical protein L484_013061 [Morus notabilis]|uniref:Agglutinin domain-containing protein n=1 Tax=Morus notabilis TaxID=981085 RepID=W9RM79_9ROSA|nr:uncharacterized protein LOC21396249 [Morus notabilis]EXB59941.1 hypothetical protein L484_013061 [Morus notabilis]